MIRQDSYSIRDDLLVRNKSNEISVVITNFTADSFYSPWVESQLIAANPFLPTPKYFVKLPSGEGMVEEALSE